jgi:hypothetical protein
MGLRIEPPPEEGDPPPPLSRKLAWFVGLAVASAASVAAVAYLLRAVLFSA